jgi:hypothetical protein
MNLGRKPPPDSFVVSSYSPRATGIDTRAKGVCALRSSTETSTPVKPVKPVTPRPPHPPLRQAFQPARDRFGVDSCTALIRIDFFPSSAQTDPLRFGGGSVRLGRLDDQPETPFRSSTWWRRAAVTALLLIRRSLVRAQVGEPGIQGVTSGGVAPLSFYSEHHGSNARFRDRTLFELHR